MHKLPDVLDFVIPAVNHKLAQDYSHINGPAMIYQL